MDTSSGPTEREHSLAIVDGILSKNGYPNPRSFNTRISGTQRKNQRKSANNNDYITLSLPYTTEKDANSVRNYIRKNNIPIRPIFTPGKTLKKILCQSRPLDTIKCVLGNPDRCAICPIITNGTCNIQGAVYEITCNLCTARNITYQGEADRPIN